MQKEINHNLNWKKNNNLKQKDHKPRNKQKTYKYHANHQKQNNNNNNDALSLNKTLSKTLKLTSGSTTITCIFKIKGETTLVVEKINKALTKKEKN